MDRYVAPSYSLREKIFLSLTANQEVLDISVSSSQLNSIPKSGVGMPIFNNYHTAFSASALMQNLVTPEKVGSTNQGKVGVQNYQAYDDLVSDFNYEIGGIGGSDHVFYNAVVPEQQFNPSTLHLSDVISPGGIGGTGHIFDDIKLPNKLDSRNLVAVKESDLDEGGGIGGTGHVSVAPLSSATSAGDLLEAPFSTPENGSPVDAPDLNFPETSGAGVGNLIHTDSSHQADNLSEATESTVGPSRETFFIECLGPTICPGIGFNDDGTIYTILPNIEVADFGIQSMGLVVNNVVAQGYDEVNSGQLDRSEYAINLLNTNDRVDQSVYFVI